MTNCCLICFSEIKPKFGWNDLISEGKQLIICPTCQSKFQQIEGPTCQICDRPLQQLDPRFIQDGTCNDCIRWEDDLRGKGA